MALAVGNANSEAQFVFPTSEEMMMCEAQPVSRLANVNKRPKVIRALRRAGLTDRPGGKHTVMTDADGNLVTTIPNSRELNPTTRRAILRQCGLTEQQYLDLYHKRGR